MDKLCYTKEKLDNIFNKDGIYSDIVNAAIEQNILSRTKKLFISHMLYHGLTDVDNISKYNKMYQTLTFVLLKVAVNTSEVEEDSKTIVTEIYEMISIFSKKYSIPNDYIKLYAKFINAVDFMKQVLSTDIISQQKDPAEYMNVVRELHCDHICGDLSKMHIVDAIQFNLSIQNITHFKAEIICKLHISLDVMLSMFLRLIRDPKYDINKEFDDICKYFKYYYDDILIFASSYNFIISAFVNDLKS